MKESRVFHIKKCGPIGRTPLPKRRGMLALVLGILNKKSKFLSLGGVFLPFFLKNGGIF